MLRSRTAAPPVLIVSLLMMTAYAQVPPWEVLLEMTAGAEKRLTPSSGQVAAALSKDAAAPGIQVTIQPGAENYPGISVKPPGAAWNLSAFGHVEARVKNTGVKPISIALRVDNSGPWQDNPWNTESVYLKPGETGTVKTIFGYAYGHKPSYALKPSAVTNILLFAGKSPDVQSFRLELLAAAGPAGEKPPVDPASIRVKPEGGLLFGGPGRVTSAQLVTASNASATMTDVNGRQTLNAVFLPNAADSQVSIKLVVGRWDLRDALEVQVRLRNTGKSTFTPRARVESNGGKTNWVSLASALNPGAESIIIVPFSNPLSANLGHQGTGNSITNDAVSAVAVSVAPAGGEHRLEVEEVRAEIPSTPQLPAWLGKRPPVDGAWVKTLDDEFDGSSLNSRIWEIHGDNYWDKESHWSKNDVLLGDGVVKLRYEKKTGYSNDDPTQKKTAYAAGYLHTYGKWTQRYGYFEARMKLPTAPGLWPAFWMMPDRGATAGPQWKRQDTANGGMEFDIMEHLTRWGRYRYNIAMHYDGYGKDHKSLGSDKIYVQLDKDGFLTCGLLWTPGSAVYYCNGKEVLRWENPRISDVPSILMFTIPQGGWDNNAIDDSKLPADFTVDYVRVWQRKDLAAASGKQITTPTG